MKQQFNLYKEKIINFWSSKTKKQKVLYTGLLLLFLFLIIGGSLLTNNTKMVPLYNDLSLQEVGQIKAELDSRGVKYELSNAGTTIQVPDSDVDTLLVELAAQGIPNSGTIDYSFFSANTSWGMTDNEFDVIKLDAMQTELANLITSIDGIEDAKVMINMPQDAVFVSEQQEAASASIVINTRPGYQFSENQIASLYHLVSKTVPNLPTDNIVIMNQNSEYFDLQDSSSNSYATDAYTFQQNVKKDIERDIQRRVQQMLGMMVGQDKVVASVTADIDFTQENRIEELVEPASEEGVEGLPVSIETIKETYSGDGAAAANGTVDPGGDVENFPGDNEENNGEYEMVKESVNNEFNRIHKEISESPYKIRDLGIQVAVDSAKDSLGEDNETQYLSQQEQLEVEQAISSVLNSIVTTSVDGSYGEINPEEKISVVFQEFHGKPAYTPTVVPAIPYWIYGVGALLVVAIIALSLLLRKRKQTEELYVDMPMEDVSNHTVDVPDIEEENETESSIRRKQLEKLAKDKPEEFAKLLRNWIAED